MNFPEVPRVFYRKTPLHEVEARAFFAPDLMIETEKPASVQQEIKDSFPVYKRINESTDHSSPDIVHEFKSEDGEWTIHLRKDQVSISTSNYYSWDQFTVKLQQVVTTIADVYNVKHYLLVALKYTDVIDRETLGFSKETAWTKLIQPYILGELSAPDIKEPEVMGSMKKFVLKDKENNFHLGVEHGLAEAEGKSETAYLIDFTFFQKQKLEVANVLSIFGVFNGKARNFFRWCITQELHDKMDPQKTDHR